MTNDELLFILDAIRQTVEKAEEWKKDYCYDSHTNEFHHCRLSENKNSVYANWFKLT
jgi:hypothetical protein